MDSRKLMAAAVFAIAGAIASPARSLADVTIQINVTEVTSSGGSAGFNTQTYSGTGTSLNTGFVGSISSSFPDYSITGINTGLTAINGTNYVGTTLNLSVSNFTTTNQLQITISYSGLTNSVGIPNVGTVSNQPSASESSNGSFSITTNSQISGFSPSPNSTATATQGSGGSGNTTYAPNISNVPNSYQFQQTINAYMTGNGSPVSGTMTGTLNSDITLTAVPAPGGLALALIGLPLIGLRRFVGRKAAA